MKDVLHVPDNSPVHEYECRDCGIELPSDVVRAAAGLDIIDVGGLHEMFIPGDAAMASGSLRCTHPGVAKVAETSKVVTASVLLPAEPEAGETVKPPTPLSDFEKRVSGQSWNNFWALRDATKPRSETTNGV